MKTSSSESDIGDYLSNLRKKTIGNKSDFHIDGLSDISLSDLSEKKPKIVEINSKFLKSKKDKQIISETFVPKKEKNNKKKKEKKYRKPTNNAKNKKPLRNNHLNVKDEEFDIIKNQKEFESESNYVPKLHLYSNSRSNFNISERSEDNDESSFGKDGNRFLKPKNVIPANSSATIISAENKINNIITDDISSSRDLSSPRKSTLRTVQSPSSKKKVTIMEHKQQCDSLSSLEFDIANSIDEMSKSRSDSGSENNQNFCGLNIMSFNDLAEDVEDEHSVAISISEHNSDVNKFEKIMSIEELEDNFSNKPVNVSRRSKSAQDNESLSEIRTVPFVTPRTPKSLSRNQSISEVQSISFAEPSEIHSITSRMYSMDFEDSVKEKTKQPISKSRNKKSPSYSSDFSDADRTSQSISNKTSIKSVAVKKSSKPEYIYNRSSKITDGPSIPMGVGRERVDHVPIAHYVVSPEALESLTAYSPSMLLMTNMFRQQIEMTKNFIETQRRLYDSLISSIQPTYQYSSLREVKEFIELNTTKPLTMKEALRHIENGK